MLAMRGAPAHGLSVALLLLALSSGVGGVSIARRGRHGRTRSGFRSVVVPYHVIAAPHTAISSLPANLSLGDLLAYEPNAPATGDLFVFLPGSNNTCKSYTQLLETVAGTMRTLCLPYDNLIPIVTLCDKNTTCYQEKRLAAFNGTFDAVGGNNVESRLVSALQYLVRNDLGDWSMYLDHTSGAPAWSRMRLAGHSQGAGTAVIIGYFRKVSRVVQLSGVCDHANWTATLGPPITPGSRFFGLASSYDNVCGVVDWQIHSWSDEGVFRAGGKLKFMQDTDHVTLNTVVGAQTIVSDLLPPNCTKAMATSKETKYKITTCTHMAHMSTAVNWPDMTSPYAYGLWQALCGI